MNNYNNGYETVINDSDSIGKDSALESSIKPEVLYLNTNTIPIAYQSRKSDLRQFENDCSKERLRREKYQILFP